MVVFLSREEWTQEIALLLDDLGTAKKNKSSSDPSVIALKKVLVACE